MLKHRYSMEFFQESADYILSRVQSRPEIVIVLGSCLGDMAGLLENPQTIDYCDIPNFLTTTVSSHAGKLIFGKLAGKDVACMSGRFHYYEGYSFEELAISVRVFKLLGIKTLLMTNAAGGINEKFKCGDIMLINDHINIYGANSTRGHNLQEFGPRFFDVCDMYTKSLRQVAHSASESTGVPIHDGVYIYYPGPNFETPAEIRAFRLLGGDAVGMSTVSEALAAAHCGIKVLAISLITNMAAGMAGPVTGEEVREAAEHSAGRFQKLMLEIVKNL